MLNRSSSGNGRKTSTFLLRLGTMQRNWSFGSIRIMPLPRWILCLVHAGVDWDWEMPVVTLAALYCGGAMLVAARAAAVSRRHTLVTTPVAASAKTKPPIAIRTSPTE
jgi:hypothetical protein